MSFEPLQLPSTLPFLVLIPLSACGTKTHDARQATDARVPTRKLIDASSRRPIDAARRDASPPIDATTTVSDASVVVADAAPPTPPHVDIYISNTCEVSTVPPSVTLPTGNNQGIVWHNHSVDYEADVWMSYGGGFLQLAKGGSWNEPAFWCGGANVGLDGSADIGPASVSSSSCPHARVPIVCQ